MTNTLCVCNQCGREYVYNRKQGGSLIKCNSCYVKNRRSSLKKESINKMGGRCSICGYSKCLHALQFHHIDPSKKKFNISSNIGKYTLQSIQNELKKCIVVCANCHAEIHAGFTEV